MGEWKPIDTQPLDGTLVLMWTRGGGCYIAPSEEIQPVANAIKRLIYEETGQWPDASFTPTHWMPLPDAPTQSEPEK